MPVIAAYSVKISEGANIVFNAGPYVGFGLGGKVDGVKIFGDAEDAMGGKSFDAGFGFGVRGEDNQSKSSQSPCPPFQKGNAECNGYVSSIILTMQKVPFGGPVPS